MDVIQGHFENKEGNFGEAVHIAGQLSLSFITFTYFSYKHKIKNRHVPPYGHFARLTLQIKADTI